MKTIYWVISVAVVSIGVFVYVLMADTQKTLPKIKLSYFKDEAEIADSVTKRLSQDLQAKSNFWVGIEPEKKEQLEFVVQLKQHLEKTKEFKRIILDEEINLPKEWQDKLKITDTVAIKANLDGTGDTLAKLEQSGQAYLVITAAIYSTPLIVGNQIHQMKEKFKIKPTTFSLAFFPVTVDEEKEMLFPCRTEDHSGTATWGCAVANKARFTRRKVDFKNEKPWIALMDLVGENDYMILLKKKD